MASNMEQVASIKSGPEVVETTMPTNVSFDEIIFAMPEEQLKRGAVAVYKVGKQMTNLTDFFRYMRVCGSIWVTSTDIYVPAYQWGQEICASCKRTHHKNVTCDMVLERPFNQGAIDDLYSPSSKWCRSDSQDARFTAQQYDRIMEAEVLILLQYVATRVKEIMKPWEGLMFLDSTPIPLDCEITERAMVLDILCTLETRGSSLEQQEATWSKIQSFYLDVAKRIDTVLNRFTLADAVGAPIEDLLTHVFDTANMLSHSKPKSRPITFLDGYIMEGKSEYIQKNYAHDSTCCIVPERDDVYRSSTLSGKQLLHYQNIITPLHLVLSSIVNLEQDHAHIVIDRFPMSMCVFDKEVNASLIFLYLFTIKRITNREQASPWSFTLKFFMCHNPPRPDRLARRFEMERIHSSLDYMSEAQTYYFKYLAALETLGGNMDLIGLARLQYPLAINSSPLLVATDSYFRATNARWEWVSSRDLPVIAPPAMLARWVFSDKYGSEWRKNLLDFLIHFIGKSQVKRAVKPQLSRLATIEEITQERSISESEN